jgi:hypothetical protein
MQFCHRSEMALCRLINLSVQFCYRSEMAHWCLINLSAQFWLLTVSSSYTINILFRKRQSDFRQFKKEEKDHKEFL